MKHRPLVLVAALVVAVGSYYGYRAIAQMQAAATARADLFALAEQALEKQKEPGFDPSKLVSGLLELGPEDHEALLLLARLETARRRFDRALGYLQPMLDEDDEVVQRTAAHASFHLQHSGALDSGAQRQMLLQALGHGERAAQSGDQSADWFLCWEAATRLGDSAAADRALAALQRHADSIEARTASLLAPLRQEGAAMPSLDAVTALVAEWRDPPIELELVQAALFLEAQQLDRALASAASMLQTAPNQFEVRQLAATVHHVAVQVEQPGPERDRHVAMRDAQIQWLDATAPADDTRRPLWLSWKQVR